MKALRVVGTIVAVVLVQVVVLLGVLFVVRTINGERYGMVAGPDATDPATYPLDQPGMTVEPIRGQYLNGFHLVPDEITRSGLVVTFGGSDGTPDYGRAVAVAGQGYEVLALFFWGADNQQRTLVDVPVDFFDEVLDYADLAPAEPLTVIGTSKGAELALVLTEHYDRIDNVVLYGPTSYRWQGLDFSPRAGGSWTYDGQELPYLDFRDGDPRAGLGTLAGLLFNTPVAYRHTYEAVVAGTADLAPARIRVEDFDGDLVVFAGEDDQVWQSEVAAEELRQRHPGRTDVHVYPGAGHIFDEPRYVAGMDLGGNPEANRAALEDSQQVLADALAGWHR